MNVKTYNKKLVEDMLREAAERKRDSVYKKVQTIFAYHSSRIGGNALSLQETEELFEHFCEEAELGQLNDQIKIIGHFKMFDDMLKNYEGTLSARTVQEYYSDLNGGPAEEQQDDRLDRLFDWFDSLKQPTISDFARFHAEFDKIHPFEDGNGRIGRMLLFKECLNRGLMPFIVLSEEKDDYLNAVKEEQKGNSGILEQIFFREQFRFLEETEDFVLSVDKYLELDSSLVKSEIETGSAGRELFEENGSLQIK